MRCSSQKSGWPAAASRKNWFARSHSVSLAVFVEIAGDDRGRSVWPREALGDHRGAVVTLPGEVTPVVGVQLELGAVARGAGGQPLAQVRHSGRAPPLREVLHAVERK